MTSLRQLICLTLLVLMCGMELVYSMTVTPGGRQQSFVVTAKVDERIELMSIIARIAGFQEYVKNDFRLYAEDVDKHFGKFKEHPAVKFAASIREANGVSFDAVMFMAVHVNPPPALTPRVPFTDRVPEKRWGKEKAEEFTRLLQQFYKDAECESFFKAHTEIYRTAESRFQQLLNKLDFDWYKRFYGELPAGEFNLCIGLLNGGGNYGPKLVHPDGKEDLYAIIGTWQTDSTGMPVYSESMLPTLVHEYNHSFINHLVYAREKQMSAAGTKVYEPVADRMKSLAYGTWQTMIVESLVRAAVLRYTFEHEAKQEVTDAALMRERNNGFLWMDELFALLGVYENNRAVFPTFRSFMPMVESYYNDLAKRIDFKATQFESQRPRVVSIEPFSNGAQDVDPALTQVTIAFDKPLHTGGYSINLGKGGREHFPIEKVIRFNESGSSITLRVKLKPEWEYEFIMTGMTFRSKDGYPLQPYTVKFKTR